MPNKIKSYMAVSLLFAFIAKQISALQFIDGDYYWHLAVGRRIFNEGMVPVFDLFSFALAGCEWINVNWLSQIIVFIIHSSSGDFGVYLLVVIVLAIISSLYAFMMLSKGVGPLVFSFASVVLFYSIFSVSLFRPQIFSLLLFSILCFLLFDQNHDRPLSYLRFAILTLIIAVWNFLHAGVLIGYVVLFLDLLGAELDRLFAGKRPIGRRSIQILLVGVIGIFAFNFHPSGFQSFYYIFSYRNKLDNEFYQYIDELFPLVQYPTLALISLGSIVVGVLFLLKEKARLNYRVLLPMIFLLLSTIKYARLAPFLMLFYAPYFALCLSRAVDGGKIRRTSTFYPYAVILFFSTVILVSFVERENFTSRRERHDIMPFGVTEFINSRNFVGKRIFSEYSAAGYFIWANENRNYIFIDGRGDLYSCNHSFKDYLKVLSLSAGYEDVLTVKYKVDYVLFPRESSLVLSLKDTNKWNVIYEDRYFTLLENVFNSAGRDDYFNIFNNSSPRSLSLNSNRLSSNFSGTTGRLLSSS